MAKEKISGKERTLAILLACLGIFGVAGIHRFYVGKAGTGVLWLLTGGLFLIGTIVDIVKIANYNFQDGKGGFLRNN